MKQLLIVFIATALSFGSMAQTQTSKMNLNLSKKDGVVMMGGKMMMVKDGKVSSLRKQMTLGNGTTVMTDGLCTKKDGTKMIMNEGDHLDMAGNIHLKKVLKRPGRLVLKENIANILHLTVTLRLA